jgi:hypothetical protein
VSVWRGLVGTRIFAERSGDYSARNRVFLWRTATLYDKKPGFFQRVNSYLKETDVAWDLVIHAYLDGDISLGRAAALLGLNRFDLLARANRLDTSLRIGSANEELVF